MPLDPVGGLMSMETSAERLSGAEASLSSGEIQVCRAPDADASIITAARAWAFAFEAVRRQESTTGGSAELALYDALVEVDALKSAELALYQAVVAAELTPR